MDVKNAITSCSETPYNLVTKYRPGAHTSYSGRGYLGIAFLSFPVLEAAAFFWGVMPFQHGGEQILSVIQVTGLFWHELIKENKIIIIRTLVTFFTIISINLFFIQPVFGFQPLRQVKVVRI